MTPRPVVEREAARVAKSLGVTLESAEGFIEEAMRRVERATLRRVRANLRAAVRDSNHAEALPWALACCRPEKRR